MRIRAGNQLSGDARTLGFGSGSSWSLTENDGDVEVSGAQAASLQAAAIGVQFEPFPASSVGSSGAPSTQVVFGVTIGVTPGAVLTGIKFRNQTAAAGTLPTTVRFGIADVTGKMLAVSGNANALASWATGVNAIPFTAPYTVPPGTQALIACFVINGAWSTTQPAMAFQNVPTQTSVQDGSFAPPNFQWAGQTDLPAVGSSLTLTSSSGNSKYLALY